MMRKLILTIILFTMPMAVFAMSEIKCVTLELKNLNKNIILPGVDDKKAAQIYFLHNVSKQSLWVDHPVEERSASAGWSSYIRPGNWSAILINRKNFILSCAVIQPGKVDYRNCAKSVSVCTSPKATFNSKRKGSYWLSEDHSWEDLLIALEKRGVKFTNIQTPKAN